MLTLMKTTRLVCPRKVAHLQLRYVFARAFRILEDIFEEELVFGDSLDGFDQKVGELKAVTELAPKTWNKVR